MLIVTFVISAHLALFRTGSWQGGAGTGTGARLFDVIVVVTRGRIGLWS